ncbi:hypothetical protein DIPPA_05235 [Diplonema papillatum]|nr:hypothetical protein DIPPA_05235 [Diplonema papillatum]
MPHVPSTQLIVMYEGMRCRVEVPVKCSVGDVRMHVVRAAGLLKRNEVHRKRAAQVWFGSRMLDDTRVPATDIGIGDHSVLHLEAPLGIPLPPRSCETNAFEYIRVSKGYATLGCGACQGNIRLRDTCLRFWRCLAQSQDGHCSEGSACPKVHLYMKSKQARDGPASAVQASRHCDSTKSGVSACGCCGHNDAAEDPVTGPAGASHRGPAHTPCADTGPAFTRKPNHAAAPTFNHHADVPTFNRKPDHSEVPTLNRKLDSTEAPTFNRTPNYAEVATFNRKPGHGEVPTLNRAPDHHSEGPAFSGLPIRADNDVPTLGRAVAREELAVPMLQRMPAYGACVGEPVASRAVDSAFGAVQTWAQGLDQADDRGSCPVEPCYQRGAGYPDHATDHASTEGLSCSASENCEDADSSTPDASPRRSWYRYEPYSNTAPGLQPVVARIIA